MTVLDNHSKFVFPDAYRRENLPSVVVKTRLATYPIFYFYIHVTTLKSSHCGVYKTQSLI